jgi:hypothetical protein
MTNITFFDTSNNLLDLFNGVARQLPAFPFFILGALAIIIFLANMNEDYKKVLMLEGYILSVVSGFFVILGWADISIIAIGAIAFVVGIFTT